jgi:hypothetical protein
MWVNTAGSCDTERRAGAATSRTFTFLVFDAILRIFKAVSWLQRFRHDHPRARSIVDRDSIAATKLFAVIGHLASPRRPWQ